MTDAGPPEFMLGLKLSRDRRAKTTQLTQSAYIDTTLDRFGMASCVAVYAPWESSMRLLPEGDPCSDGTTRYQQLIGSLIWAAITTRPDLAYAVSTLEDSACNLPSSRDKLAFGCSVTSRARGRSG